MVAKARNRNIFLMEALWSKFLPHYQLLMQYIREGTLGSLQSVLINFGFAVGSDPVARIYEPSLGGGSLLDIGIYNVFFALSALGEPDEVQAWMTPAPTGVDAQCAVTFRYNNGSFAQLFSSFTSNLPTEALFNGTKGSVRLSTRFYEPPTTFEYYPDKIQSKQIIPFERTKGWGYHYEIRHVNECLLQGRKESPVMRMEDSLLLMRVLDKIRSKAGIRYEVD
jgi:predicted dehydrogenase